MPVDLHLAKDMDELNVRASEGVSILSSKSSNIKVLYKVAKNIFQGVNRNKEDDELTYVYAYRFLKLLEVIYTRDTDKRFVHVQFESMRKEVVEIYTQLEKSLPQRYKTLAAKTQDVKKTPVQTLKDVKPPDNIFNKDNNYFVMPKQLYEAIEKVPRELLIIDIRQRIAFEESHLNTNANMINVDLNLIERGMSASKLEEKLSRNAKEFYGKRDYYKYIVLMDFDSTKDTYHQSKLKILYDMLTTWDINKNYQNPPYVLDGGYVDLIDMYPTMSTNSSVVCSQRYGDLDDLLNLDSIDYPVLIERFEGSFVPQTVEEAKQGVEGLYKVLVKHTEKLKEIEEQMYRKDCELLEMFQQCGKNEYPKNREQLDHERAAIDLERGANIEKKNELTTQFLAELNKMQFNEAEYLNRPELLQMEKAIVELSRKRRKLSEKFKKFETEVEVDDKPQEPVTQVPVIPKQPISGDSAFNKKVPSPDVTQKPFVDAKKRIPPEINRASKPMKGAVSGLNGLVNIRNSCYMNSIIQCMRHIPQFRYFFVSGQYKSHISRDKPKLILQFGDLIQRLWMNNNQTIRPQEFYNKMIETHPTFGKGNHEDANEFFMILFQNLHEDIARPFAISKQCAEQKASFYRSLQEKNSFFIEQFYYQVRIRVHCPGCPKMIERFEMENMICLTLPTTRDFDLEEMVDDALYLGEMSFCKECEQSSEIRRSLSLQPSIITILLKRYHDDGGIVKKINSRCIFPLENFKVGSGSYKLWGACLHSGSVYAGHYTAVCLNIFDNKWYEFNDEIVRPADMKMPEIGCSVYMLFYQITNDKLVRFM